MNQYKIVNFQEILKLPKLKASDFGWYAQGPEPSILVLCANKADKDRLVKMFQKMNIQNQVYFVQHLQDVYSLNPFTIFRSRNVMDDEVFSKCVERVNLRCRGATVGGIYNLFYPAWAVSEDEN